MVLVFIFAGDEKLSSPVLLIESMDRHKGGTYICTANNGVGQPASTQVVLHVLCKCFVAFIFSYGLWLWCAWEWECVFPPVCRGEIGLNERIKFAFRLSEMKNNCFFFLLVHIYWKFMHSSYFWWWNINFHSIVVQFIISIDFQKKKKKKFTFSARVIW